MPSTTALPTVNPAIGPRRGRVALLLGCVQRCFDPSVNIATVSVLQANGFEVVLPPDQGCCGAVSHHQGEMELTRQLASALVDSMNAIEGQLDAVLVAASGCGHTMKAYGEILHNNNGFRAPVLDVHEFLTNVGIERQLFCPAEAHRPGSGHARRLPHDPRPRHSATATRPSRRHPRIWS